MLKTALLIIIFCCVVYIGVCIANHYKLRKMFFESLINFCNHLKAEIGFSKLGLSCIVAKYAESYSKEFYMVIKNFPSQIAMSPILTKAECLAVNNFLNNLGKFDCITEQENIKSALISFDSFLSQSVFSFNKNYSTTIKLCVLMAIGILIVLW